MICNTELLRMTCIHPVRCISKQAVTPRAQVYNNLGGALHALERSVTLSLRAVMLCSEQGFPDRYEDSLSRFDVAIRLVPDMVMAYVNKGEALRIMGRCRPDQTHLGCEAGMKPGPRMS